MTQPQFKVVSLGALLEQSPQNGYSPVCPDEPTGKWVLSLAALDGVGFNPNGVKPAPIDDPLVDRFRLEPGDFLISRSNTADKVGRVAVFRGEIGQCSYPDLMMRFRPNPHLVDPLYLEHYLKSEAVVSFIQRHATGTSGSMKKINQTIVESIPVVLPSPQEQKAIAAIVDDWHAAIETTERLIAVKERFYAHELSRLISRDHHAQWRTVALSDIATVWKGQQLNKEHMEKDGAYYVINGGVKPSGRTSNWNCEAGTVTISEGGSCGFVYYNSERFWCGGHCYALKDLAKDLDATYLFHYLKSKQDRLMALRVGSGLPNIQKSDIEAFPVVLPDLTTQTAIARYLNALREEITLLTRSHEALKRQKRGLMQKLLTGKWRVPLPGAESTIQEASSC